MALDLFLKGSNRPVIRGTLKDISDALWEVQESINAGSFGIDAASVTFDPTSTDMSATDVDAAIKANWTDIRNIDIDGNTRTILIRADTAANLASADAVLAEFELVYESDTGLSKLGDGATAYTFLPYTSSGGPLARNAVAATSGDVTLTDDDLASDFVEITEDLTGNLTLAFAASTRPVREVRVQMSGNPGAFTAKVVGLLSPAAGEITIGQEETAVVVVSSLGAHGLGKISATGAGGSAFALATTETVVTGTAATLTAATAIATNVAGVMTRNRVVIRRSDPTQACALTLLDNPGTDCTDWLVVVDDVGPGALTITCPAGTTVNGLATLEILNGRSNQVLISRVSQTTGSPDTAVYKAEGAIKSGYAEPLDTTASASGAITLDYALSNNQKITVTGNITGVTINNPPPTGQTAILTVFAVVGGSGGYTYTDGKVAPDDAETFPTNVGDVAIFTYTSLDGGTTWWRSHFVIYTAP